MGCLPEACCIQTLYFCSSIHYYVQFFFYSFDTDDVTVIVGEYDLRKSKQKKELPVSRIIMHEGFVRKTFTHDIALLQLQTTLTFSNKIQPICFPAPGENLEGKDVTVIGMLFSYTSYSAVNGKLLLAFLFIC